jgi:hypothetical protein
LTGAPCEKLDYKTDKVEVRDLIKELKQKIGQGYLMGTSIDKDIPNET